MQFSRRVSMGVGIVALTMLAGCGDPIGAACDFSGSGFTASDNCRYRCLEHRPINCPDGSTVNPHVCSGPERCSPGSCGDGQACYTDQDPFNNESFCVPQAICGSNDSATLAQWERDTEQSAVALRLEYAERKRLREKNSAPSPDAVVPGT